MIKQHEEILYKASNLAGTNPDIYNAIKQICIGWSDGNFDTLFETYEYLEAKKNNELKEFMSMLAYMVRVSN